MRRSAAYRRPVPETPTEPSRDATLPGLTACSLCAGETLGEDDPLPGGQLARLRAVAGRGAARLTEVECLDECERGDVVVARPSGACRRAGARPVWFERLAGERSTAVLEGWLRAGGPGARPVPPQLSGHVVHRTADAPDAPDDVAVPAR